MWNELDGFVAFLEQNDIEYIELTPIEIKNYKQEWFHKFVPSDKQKKALDSYCFDKDGYCGYLWHVFSYEILDCVTNDIAKKFFDELLKQQVILLANIDDVAYRIKDISKLKADDFGILYDVIITDIDFGWTYVKTHEEMCGPYFYNICTL